MTLIYKNSLRLLKNVSPRRFEGKLLKYSYFNQPILHSFAFLFICLMVSNTGYAMEKTTKEKISIGGHSTLKYQLLYKLSLLPTMPDPRILGDVLYAKLLLLKTEAPNDLFRIACEEGDFALAELLLNDSKDGFPIDEYLFKSIVRHENCNTLLQALVKKGFSITKNLNPDSGSGFAHFCIDLACESGNVAAVKFLVDKGATITLKCLFYATFSKSLELIQYLHDTAGANLKIKWTSVLHSALSSNAEEIIRFILRRFQELQIDVAKCYEQELINFLANDEEGIALLEILKKYGFDLKRELESPTDHRRRPLNPPMSCLDIACKNGNIPMVDFLIENNVPITESNFSNAIVGGSLPIVKILLQHAKKDLKINWQNLFSQAVTLGHLAIVSFIIEEFKVNPNLANDSGEIPLLNAVFLGNLSMVRYLLAHGATITLKDADGDTVLHKACQGCARLNENEHLELIGLLCTPEVLATPTNNAGDTVLHKICTNARISVFSELDEQPINEPLWPKLIAIIKFLLTEKRMRIEVNDVNNSGLSALRRLPFTLQTGASSADFIKYIVLSLGAHKQDAFCHFEDAIIHGDEPTVTLLLEWGILAIDEFKNKANIYLHRASWYGNLPVLKCLVERGIQPTFSYENTNEDIIYCTMKNRDYDDARYSLETIKYLLDLAGTVGYKTELYKSYLLFFCKVGDLELINYLLEEKGIDCNFRSKIAPHMTPLEIALYEKNAKVALYLFERGAQVKNSTYMITDFEDYSQEGAYEEVNTLAMAKGLGLKAIVAHIEDHDLIGLCEKGDIERVKYLVKNPDIDRNMPLVNIAFYNNHDELANFLLALGFEADPAWYHEETTIKEENEYDDDYYGGRSYVSVEIVTVKKRTYLLDVAIRKGLVDLVTKLLDKGAKVCYEEFRDDTLISSISAIQRAKSELDKITRNPNKTNLKLVKNLKLITLKILNS